MSEKFQKLFLPSSIFILLLILFSEALLGRIIWICDIYIFETFCQWLPYKEFIAHCYISGFFPLWTHNLECGFPLASFPHSASFYLLNLFFIFLDYVRAITLFSLFQELILCYFSYLCARELSFSRLASWIFSLSFGLSGVAYIFAGSLPLHGTISWLPAVFLFSMRLARKPRLVNLLGLIFSSSVQITAGDPEQIIYQDIIILTFLLFIKRASLKIILLWSLIILFSFLVASVQVLPLANLLYHSFRKIRMMSGAAQSSPLWVLLLLPLGLFAPFRLPFQNIIVSSPYYLGFMFLLGLFFAWKNPASRRELKILLLFGTLGLIYFINPWPICNIGILGAAVFRYKFIGPFQFWMLMVACSGINQLCQSPWSKAQIHSVRNFILAFAIWTALLILACLILENKIPLPNLSSFFLVPFRIVFAFLALLFAVFIKSIAQKESRRNSLLLSLLALLFLADIFLSAWALRPRQSPQLFLEKPPGLEFLQKQNPTHRIHYVSYLNANRELIWRYHELYKGPGYIHSFIRIGLQYTTPLLFKISRGDFSLMHIESLNAETKPILDMLGARYVVARAPFFWGMNPRPLNPFYLVSPQPLIAPGHRIGFKTELFPGDVLWFHTLTTPDHLKVYLSLNGQENELQIQPESMPIKLDIPSTQDGKIIFENSISEESGPSLFLSEAYLANPSRPYQLVYKDEIEIYENPSAWPRYFLADEEMSEPDREADLPQILEYHPDSVELRFSTERPGQLAIMESYYPGWHAFVDGTEERIYRANSAFQAVSLPAGDHLVHLSYKPLEFEIGLWLSLASLFALFLIFILFLSRLFGQCPSGNKRHSS